MSEAPARQLEVGLPRVNMYAPAFREKVLADRQRKELAEIVARETREREEREARLRRAQEHCSRVEMIDRAAGCPATIKSIQQRIAAEHGLSLDVILGSSRTKGIVKVRWAAIAAVHLERPDLSLGRLARAFCRDHTSILHALRKTGSYLGADRAGKAADDAG